VAENLCAGQYTTADLSVSAAPSGPESDPQAASEPDSVQEHTLDAPNPTSTRVHQIAFLRNGHSWRLQWDSGNEDVLVDTLAALVADPSCPLDAFDQALVEQHLASPKKPATH
jgi:hypothetical protein